MIEDNVRTSNLCLGDVIRLFDGPFSDGIVRQIDGDIITVFRPYATTANFTFTGGVITYIGIEDVRIPRSDELQYSVTRLRKSDLPEILAEQKKEGR